MKIYLSGAIYKDNKEATDLWRTQAYVRLKQAGFKVVNPCRDRVIYDAASFTPQEIVARDSTDIARSGLILVNGNPLGDHLSIGTWMEVQLAHSQGKPIVVFSTDERVIRHPWLKCYAARIFPSLDEALRYIIQFWGE